MSVIRTILICIASAAVLPVEALAFTPATRDIDVNIVLNYDGKARVSETWNICSTEGTEWYIPRYNLGAIEISDFGVSDETGMQYVNVGVWDVDRSLAEKAGKCGIARTGSGCELCWGIGSYGDHIFTASYTMTNAVQGMDDYDVLHLQLVNQGVKPRPGHASVKIAVPGTSLDSTNCAVWAFGFNGTVGFNDGNVVAETLEGFKSDAESVIILVRFDKGLFTTEYNPGGAFQDKLDEAFKGSSYQDFIDNEKEERAAFIGMLVFVILGTAVVITGLVVSVRRRNQSMFGVNSLKELGYDREIPFGGNLFESLLVLRKVGYSRDGSSIAGAIILRMIYKGFLTVVTGRKNKVELMFSRDADVSALAPPEKELYEMMKAASGDDGILQDKEFSRWSRKHASRVSKWCSSVDVEGSTNLRRDGLTLGTRFSPEGQLQARRTIGLRKFLKDFTLIDERSVPEVTLWQEYLVFASLFGVADKVAAQLKDIDPKQFQETVGYEPMVMHRILYMSNIMGASITSAAASFQTSGSVSGHGGFSSFGGGGGFSGGGFGGGAR